MLERARRSRVLSLLSEACEIEHGLACSYLFAAFTLKRGQPEGLSFEQEQLVRKWAAQISFVATQEMLHLAQAWNLLQAIGGTPYHLHGVFPVERGELEVRVPMTLEGFSRQTLQRFLSWERPADLRADRRDFGEPQTTVGRIYAEIERLVREIPEDSLFIASRGLQIGPAIADFPDVAPIHDRASACRAIDAIRAQGEGSPQDRDDCHYGMFHSIALEFERAVAADSTFEPALAVVANPVRRPSPGGTLVADPTTLQVMALFDDLYGLAIRMLAWVFGAALPSDVRTRASARFAIDVMPVALRSLGELLTRMPSGRESLSAGPSFSIARHVPLPEDPRVTMRIVVERAREIEHDLLDAVGLPKLSSEHAAQLRRTAEKLTVLTSRLIDCGAG